VANGRNSCKKIASHGFCPSTALHPAIANRRRSRFGRKCPAHCSPNGRCERHFFDPNRERGKATNDCLTGKPVARHDGQLHERTFGAYAAWDAYCRASCRMRSRICPIADHHSHCQFSHKPVLVASPNSRQILGWHATSFMFFQSWEGKSPVFCRS
jgi:hypothetical protein